MQKTSRINSDKSSIVDNQKERKLTTPNRSNNTVASRNTSDTPRNTSTNAQHIDHPRSTPATDTASRPPTQQLDHRHSSSATDTAHRPPTQHLDHRATHRPTRSNTTSKHKQIRAEIRHHTYNTQRFSPLPISIPAKQISIICHPSSHRIQISVSPMQNPQKCSTSRSKF